jgi:hypothetical protein
MGLLLRAQVCPSTENWALKGLNWQIHQGINFPISFSFLYNEVNFFK